MQDTPSPAPTEFGGDPTIWATWLYYAESKTQAEVAHALGISRASVANYLAAARRQNLVSITVAPDLLSRVGVAEALREKFGLAGVFVAPETEASEDAPQALRDRLGTAGAQAVLQHLQPDTVLGVAWGRTMAALGLALPEREMKEMRVVQVSGSSLGDEESSPEACTLQIAARLGAICRNFHAPAVVTDPALRDALLAEPSIARQRDRVRSCGIVVFAVGELNEMTRWADSDTLIRPSAETYRKNGSVGIVLGRFIDAAGNEVEGPLSGRQIGMELDELRAVPQRLCVSGGPEKYEAIRATLAGGYVTHFITDAATASHLLEGE